MSKPRRKSPTGAEPAAIHQGTAPLLADLRQLIEQARLTAAAAVNAGLTLTYWRIGHRIRTEVLGGQRAGYGEEIVATLSRQLAADYGCGFEEKNLRRVMQFAEVFPSEKNVVSLIRHLSWTHLLVLLPVKDALARDFYSQMCQLEGWSVRTLRERVNSLLYERTALSHQPEALIRQELGELKGPKPTEPAMLLKDPMSSISWDCRIATSKRISRTPSCANWRLFCSNSAPASASWRGSGAFSSTATISISTCFSITASCAASWPSN